MGAGNDAALEPDQCNFTVAIATYQRPTGLRRTLAAIVPQTGSGRGREIVVVNDGSHDDAYAAVVAEFAPYVRYRALPSNVGVAEARNAAAEMAWGRYLVYTDDDCVPPPWWLDWLEARLAAAPDLDVVAGTTKPLFDGKRRFFGRMQAEHRLLPRPWKVHDAVQFATANVAIRRELFWKVGAFGFPGQFHGAGEDTELSNRLSLSGAAGCIDWNWFVYHEIAGSLAGLCRRYRRYGYANGWMTGLTTAPVATDGLEVFTRRSVLGNWRNEWRVERRYAPAVSGTAIGRFVSTFLATMVKLSYVRGAAAGFLARRRSERRVAP